MNGNRIVVAVAVCVGAAFAFGLGLKRTYGQVTVLQPFTAVESEVTTSSKLLAPRTKIWVTAVGENGSKVARIIKHGTGTMRAVWDRDAKTKVLFDSNTKMLVHEAYEEIEIAADPGSKCEGTPDGKIEGFDVLKYELPAATAPNGGSSAITRWNAPKLGCLTLKQVQIETDSTGVQLFRFVHTVSEIVLGEPDPKYFDVTLPAGFTEGSPEDYRAAAIKLNAKKAQ